MTDMYIASFVISLISLITSLISISPKYIICAPIAIVGGIIGFVIYYLGRKNATEKSVLGSLSLAFAIAAIALTMVFFAINATRMSSWALERAFDIFD